MNEIDPSEDLLLVYQKGFEDGQRANRLVLQDTAQDRADALQFVSRNGIYDADGQHYPDNIDTAIRHSLSAPSIDPKVVERCAEDFEAIQSDCGEYMEELHRLQRDEAIAEIDALIQEGENASCERI